MIEVRWAPEFRTWFDALRDNGAKVRILSRIHRAEEGNPGDVKSIGGGVSEMRIHHGPGYRLYFITEGSVMIVLLCGGDKASQSRDIEKARKLASVWRG